MMNKRAKRFSSVLMDDFKYPCSYCATGAEPYLNGDDVWAHEGGVLCATQEHDHSENGTSIAINAGVVKVFYPDGCFLELQ